MKQQNGTKIKPKELFLLEKYIKFTNYWSLLTVVTSSALENAVL